MEVAVFASASPYEHPIVIYFIVSMTRSWPNGYADKLWKVSKEGRSLLLWKEADAACGICYLFYMGVSKTRGTPKWVVYKGKPY